MKTKQQADADAADAKGVGWGPGWLFDDPVLPEPPTGVVSVSDPPCRLPWRAQIAEWPILWREQWGRRVAELESAGMSWREAEECAFNEMCE